MALYEKYGEFDSFEEINLAVANQKNEGDLEAVKEIAKENGIDEMDVEDFINGDIDTLCTLTSAAVGKLSVEKEQLEMVELMSDWEAWIEKECLENASFAAAVRKKGKSLAEVMAKLMDYAFENSIEVPKEIKKHSKAGSKASKVTFGVPGMVTAARLIREYYLGGDAE